MTTLPDCAPLYKGPDPAGRAAGIGYPKSEISRSRRLAAEAKSCPRQRCTGVQRRERNDLLPRLSVRRCTLAAAALVKGHVGCQSLGSCGSVTDRGR